MSNPAPRPATIADQLAVIEYCRVRLAKIAGLNPAAVDAAAEDVWEAYLLLIGAAEKAEELDHHEALHRAGPEVVCPVCAQEAAAEDEAYSRNADGAGQPPVRLAHSA